jgi:hypothetical protein
MVKRILLSWRTWLIAYRQRAAAHQSDGCCMEDQCSSVTQNSKFVAYDFEHDSSEQLVTALRVFMADLKQGQLRGVINQMHLSKN